MRMEYREKIKELRKSYNEKAEIRINFTVSENIRGVILDKAVIEF